MGIEIAIIMAKVPQEVPVEKAIKELITKITAGKKAGDNQSLDQFAINCPVPRALQASPMANANSITKASGINSLIPLSTRSIISLVFIIFWDLYSTMATKIAVSTAYRTEDEPEPFPMALNR